VARWPAIAKPSSTQAFEGIPAACCSPTIQLPRPGDAIAHCHCQGCPSHTKSLVSSQGHCWGCSLTLMAAPARRHWQAHTPKGLAHPTLPRPAPPQPHLQRLDDGLVGCRHRRSLHQRRHCCLLRSAQRSILLLLPLVGVHKVGTRDIGAVRRVPAAGGRDEGVARARVRDRRACEVRMSSAAVAGKLRNGRLSLPKSWVAAAPSRQAAAATALARRCLRAGQLPVWRATGYRNGAGVPTEECQMQSILTQEDGSTAALYSLGAQGAEDDAIVQRAVVGNSRQPQVILAAGLEQRGVGNVHRVRLQGTAAQQSTARRRGRAGSNAGLREGC
jgi:hypothetical protein